MKPKKPSLVQRALPIVAGGVIAAQLLSCKGAKTESAPAATPTSNKPEACEVFEGAPVPVPIEAPRGSSTPLPDFYVPSRAKEPASMAYEAHPGQPADLNDEDLIPRAAVDIEHFTEPMVVYVKRKVTLVDSFETDYLYFAWNRETLAPGTQFPARKLLAERALQRDPEEYDAMMLVYTNLREGYEGEYKVECVAGSEELCENFARSLGLGPEGGVESLNVATGYYTMTPFLIAAVGVQEHGDLLQGEAAVMHFPPSPLYGESFRYSSATGYNEKVDTLAIVFGGPLEVEGGSWENVRQWLQTSPYEVRLP